MRIILRILGFAFCLVLLTLAGLTLYVRALSQGEPAPFVDAQGQFLPQSLSEQIWVSIEGADQGMILRGRDQDLPVLLFVHGGPGMPETFLNETYATDLEAHFLVCWWEARGGGLSYAPGMDPATITMAQAIQDTHAVAAYLRDRFGQDKVYLMGHSFGSLVGIQAAADRPDLYHAYIGMAQASGRELAHPDGNRLTYQALQEIFQDRGDRKALKTLESHTSHGPDGSVAFDPEALSQLDALKHRAGLGTMHHMDSAVTGIFFPHLTSRLYRLQEKINLWRGRAFLRSTPLYEESLATDLFQKDLQLAVPVYIWSGVYDYTCPYPLTQAYYHHLDADQKAFYTFDHSAHSPLWEEPDTSPRILRDDVLTGKAELADVP